jgi:putative addiction module antidote
MIKLKVTKIGDSVGVIFPKELMDKLNIKDGDALYLVETPDGFEVKSDDAELMQQMEVAEEVMREDHDVLSKLA